MLPPGPYSAWPPAYRRCVLPRSRMHSLRQGTQRLSGPRLRSFVRDSPQRRTNPHTRDAGDLLVLVLRALFLLVQRLEHPVPEERVVDELDARVRNSRNSSQLVEVAAALVLPAPGRFHSLRVVGEVVRSAVLQRGNRALARGKARLERLRDTRARRRLSCAERVTREQHAGAPRRPCGEAHRQPP